MNHKDGWLRGLLLALTLFGGCSSPTVRTSLHERPDIAPTTQPAAVEALELTGAAIEPMYGEVLSVDLPTVVQVAVADNLGIRRARQEVEAMRGRLESARGAALPVLLPTAAFEHVEGTVRATEGNLVGVGFDTFQPSIALQWVLNPGRIIYELVAAKKRLSATQELERAVVLATLETAGVQYYELVLAQARVAAARQAVDESEELLRINRLKVKGGVGVPADELRAEAQLAERQQGLATAVHAFYRASVALAVTLHLDPSVTLVPNVERIAVVDLVRSDLTIETLLEVAVDHRPDLERLRTLLEAASAERGATWWRGFGPGFALNYQYGGITGHADNVVGGQGVPGNLIVNPLSPGGSFSANPVANGLVKEGLLRGSRKGDGDHDRTFGFSDQQRIGAAASWRLSLATFGEIKTADAIQQQVLIDLERRLDTVRAEVVTAAQTSKTQRELIGMARRQVTSAEEALRLTQANLQAGTMTTLDVLQSQDAAARARLHFADAVVRFNQSQVNLLAALGLLDETSLVQSNGES